MGSPNEQLAHLGANYKTIHFEQIDDLSSVVRLNATYRKKAHAVRICVEGQNVRFRADGSDPTAAIGGRMLADTSEWVPQAELDQLRMIEETAGAIVNVHYYGM